MSPVPSRFNRGNQTPAARIQQALATPFDPMPCKKCGSICFSEETYQMYTPGGSDFRSISTSPQKLYRCICGTIQMPRGFTNGMTPGGERDLFAQSIQLAQQYMDQSTPDAIAKNVAGVHELRALQAQVQALKQQLEELGIEVIAPNPEAVAETEPEAEAEAQTEAEQDDPEAYVPPVADAGRGRSELSMTPPTGDTKFVEPPRRPVVAGGAKKGLKRQGQK